MGLPEESYTLASGIYHSILNKEIPEHNGRFDYFIQILIQFYANLKVFDRANQMYFLALKFTEESHYTQGKAKTLNGLAEICRQHEEFDLALANHLEAIELLDKLVLNAI